MIFLIKVYSKQEWRGVSGGSSEPKASSPCLKGAFLYEEPVWGDQPLLADIHPFKSSMNVEGFLVWLVLLLVGCFFSLEWGVIILEESILSLYPN